MQIAAHNKALTQINRHRYLTWFLSFTVLYLSGHLISLYFIELFLMSTKLLNVQGANSIQQTFLLSQLWLVVVINRHLQEIQFIPVIVTPNIFPHWRRLMRDGAECRSATVAWPVVLWRPGLVAALLGFSYLAISAPALDLATVFSCCWPWQKPGWQVDKRSHSRITKIIFWKYEKHFSQVTI